MVAHYAKEEVRRSDVVEANHAGWLVELPNRHKAVSEEDEVEDTHASQMVAEGRVHDLERELVLVGEEALYAGEHVVAMHSSGARCDAQPEKVTDFAEPELIPVN